MRGSATTAGPGSVVARAVGTRVDHYELVNHLADGSQAEVHRARDLRDGTEVAIKFPHARTLANPVLAARWRREAAITEGLRSPGIQCRRDLGERHSEPYLVLENASGGTLRTWIDSGPLPVSQVVDWSRQLAEALAYLHDRGIVHRDLKPENLLVTDEMTIKLADFGAASATRRRRWLRMPSPPEGTSEYISPEQIRGRPGDERSDIYGWGIVAYELLTERVPFTGPDPVTAMDAHLRDHPVSPQQLRPDVPAALDAIVMTAIRRSPERRHQSARELLDHLDHLGSVDPSTFDLSPEAPMSGSASTAELRAFGRLALLIATTFVSVVSALIVLTAVLR